MMDATPTNRLCELVCEDLANATSGAEITLSNESEPLYFNITPRILQHIKKAEQAADKLVPPFFSIEMNDDDDVILFT